MKTIFHGSFLFGLLGCVVVGKHGGAEASLVWNDGAGGDNQDLFTALWSRLLTVGDFDSFNDVLQNVTLRIPDPEPITQNLLFTLTIHLSNLYCIGLRIGDMATNYTVNKANSELTFSLDLFPFSMDCFGEYQYDYSFMSSSGTLQAAAVDNQVQLALGFLSPSTFDQAPPNQTTVQSCQADIKITNLDLSGGIESVIASIFQDAVSNLVSNQASKAICNNTDSAFQFLDDLLDKINDFMVDVEQPYNITDPLQPERDMLNDIDSAAAAAGVDENATTLQDHLINLQYGGGKLGSSVRSLIQDAGTFLSGMTDDPNHVNGQDLSVNVWLRDNVLNADGVFTVKGTDLGDGPLFQTTNRLVDLAVVLNSVQIKGLDTFQTFKPVELIGNYTMQNGFALQSVSVEAELRVDMETSTSNNSLIVAEKPVTGVETIRMGFNLTDLNVGFALLIAANWQKLGLIQFGSLLQFQTIFPCVVQGMADFEIAGLNVSLGSMSNLLMEGIGSPGFSRVATSVVDAVFLMYKPTVMRVLPAAFHGRIRRAINEKVVDPIINGEKSSCTNRFVDTTNNASLIDFRDLLKSRSEAAEMGATGKAPYGTLIPNIWNMIDEKFLKPNETTGMAPLNEKIIVPLTKRQSGIPGTFAFPGNLINETFRFILMEMEFRIRVYDVSFENLDTVGVPFSPLTPVQGEGQTLDNVATMGVTRPLRLNAKVYFRLYNEHVEGIENSIQLSFIVEDASILLNLILNIVRNAIFGFPIKDISNLNCLLATLQTPTLDAKGVRKPGHAVPFQLLNFTSTFEGMRMNLTCIDCGSPRMIELAERLNTPEGINGGTKLATTIMDIITDQVGPDILALELDRRIAEAAERCPHRPEYKSKNATSGFELFESPGREKSYKFLIALVVVVVLLVILVALFLTRIRAAVRRRHQEWVAGLPDDHVLLLWKQQQGEKDLQVEVDKTTESLATSPDVPQYIKYVMPSVVVANIALFLVGHICAAASVNLSVAFAGDVYREANFYDFSIASGTINLWKAGGYELAILIILFSGVWPYTKQAITLYLWYADPNKVPTGKRLNIYLWLDVLAKWSIVDIFTLLVSLVAFRVTILSPNVAFLPEDFYTVDIMVMPKIGLYANLTAQVVSQISSHFIIYYHRKLVREARRRLGQQINVEGESNGNNQNQHYSRTDTTMSDAPDMMDAEEKLSLSAHAFTRPHRGENDRLVPRSYVNPMLCVVAVLIAIFVIIGCALPSFSAEILGVFGLVVESGNNHEPAITYYSMFSMMKVLFSQANFTKAGRDYLGLGFLAALLFGTVLLAPILQALLLLYQWFGKLTLLQRKRMLTVNEIIQAWQYMEVYALSVVIGSWQLTSASHYMLNIFCEEVPVLQDIFGQLAYFGILDARDAQCFLVDSKIEGGFILLLAAAILLALLNTFVYNAALQYLREIDASSKSSMAIMKMEKQISADEARTVAEPPSILFTDRFRWCLVSTSVRPEENRSPSQTATNEFNVLEESMKKKKPVQEQHNGLSSTKLPRVTDE